MLRIIVQLLNLSQSYKSSKGLFAKMNFWVMGAYSGEKAYSRGLISKFGIFAKG